MDEKQLAIRIDQDITESGVIIPQGYAVENAIKHAFLALAQTVDRQKRPALSVCTKESIYDALLDMVVQGLNPAKRQCYFVVYGRQLKMIMSYMGSQNTAKIVDRRITGFTSDVVYEEDNFEFEIVNGKKIIKPAIGTLKSRVNSKIIGAYAIAISSSDPQLYTEVMTITEIKASWKQSRARVIIGADKVDMNSTHGKFPVEMCKRTVLNRLCKHIINTSDDTGLLSTAEETIEDRSIQEDIEKDANKVDIDVTPFDIDPTENKKGDCPIDPVEEKKDDEPGW